MDKNSLMNGYNMMNSLTPRSVKKEDFIHESSVLRIINSNEGYESQTRPYVSDKLLIILASRVFQLLCESEVL